MRVVDLIGKKRAGKEHSEEEITFLIRRYTQGSVPDYQMSAWLMAVVWRGLTERETFALTGAMVASGETLDLSGVPGFPLDKHSTGGVGDKTTLAVVPILAAAGVVVAKMSGRGLGNTGGTLDKLESIPGMRVRLAKEEILSQVRRIGACICAQTEQLVPADRMLYALRDATATVESLPLIAASIMSKKIAGGSRAIVLDVKVGSGAFMKSHDDARGLADLMVKIGEAHGRKVVAVLTDMTSPLGYNIGNIVEIREVVALLKDNPWTEKRLKALVLYLSAVGLMKAERVASIAEGEALADELIKSGAAFQRLCDIVGCQGGSIDALTHTIKQAKPRVKLDIKAPCDGIIAHIDAGAMGAAAMSLGAGRAVKEDIIDPSAGILLRHHIGDSVYKDTVIATLCTSSEVTARQAVPIVEQAYTFSDREPERPPLIYETIGL